MSIADELQQHAVTVRALEREAQNLRRENRRLKLRISQLKRLAGVDADSKKPSSPGLEKPWDILGVSPGADATTINAAFRALSRIHHPDVPGGDRESFEVLVQAKTAMLGQTR